MTLAQLRYLVAIVDAGLNITLAAERVHATQPGISKQLRQLEDELGFSLFQRRGKSLAAITPEGAEVVERARVIVREAGNIRALSVALRADNGGELAIATSHTQARFVLPSVVSQLKAAMAALTVRIQPGDRDDVEARLARGDVDVALISTSGDPPEVALALPIYRWRQMALVPKGHVLARDTRPGLAALAAHAIVSYDTSLRPESSLRRTWEAGGHSLNVACTAQDADTIKAYVREGLGVGVLAEMALLPGDAADLVAITLEHLLPWCTTWLLLREDRVLTAPLDALIGALAPHVDRIAVRRRLAGERDVALLTGEVPDWGRWRRDRLAA